MNYNNALTLIITLLLVSCNGDGHDSSQLENLPQVPTKVSPLSGCPSTSRVESRKVLVMQPDSFMRINTKDLFLEESILSDTYTYSDSVKVETFSFIDLSFHVSTGKNNEYNSVLYFDEDKSLSGFRYFDPCRQISGRIKVNNDKKYHIFIIDEYISKTATEVVRPAGFFLSSNGFLFYISTHERHSNKVLSVNEVSGIFRLDRNLDVIDEVRYIMGQPIYYGGSCKLTKTGIYYENIGILVHGIQGRGEKRFGDLLTAFRPRDQVYLGRLPVDPTSITPGAPLWSGEGKHTFGLQ